LELIRAIRQRSIQTHIIMLTGYSSVEIVEQALHAGVDEVWSKEAFGVEYIPRIKEILSREFRGRNNLRANSSNITQTPTILIMDDDLAMQTVLEIALREAGYNVVLANDGQEGIEKLTTLKPDLVVSDIMMPQMDGVETFQRIKEHLEDEGIPI